MKALLITPFVEGFGGVEVMNSYLKKALAAKGITLEVMAANEYAQSVPKILLKLFGLPIASAIAYYKRTDNYDIVIANGEFSFGIRHPKLITIFHGTYYGLAKSMGPIYSLKQKIVHYWLGQIQKWGARKSYVVTVSPYNSEMLKQQGIVASKIINNPMPQDGFCSCSNPLPNGHTDRYLFVGSYHYLAKGFDRLEMLANSGVAIDCVTNRIPAASLGYLGEVSREELFHLMPTYQALIHPSRFESSCLVVIEAMAHGLPVLMHRTGIAEQLELEIPEFVIDFNVATVEQIRQRLQHIASHREILSVKAMDYVRRYHSWDDYLKNWSKLIDQMMERSYE